MKPQENREEKAREDISAASQDSSMGKAEQIRAPWGLLQEEEGDSREPKIPENAEKRIIKLK